MTRGHRLIHEQMRAKETVAINALLANIRAAIETNSKRRSSVELVDLCERKAV